MGNVSTSKPSSICKRTCRKIIHCLLCIGPLEEGCERAASSDKPIETISGSQGNKVVPNATKSKRTENTSINHGHKFVPNSSQGHGNTSVATEKKANEKEFRDEVHKCSVNQFSGADALEKKNFVNSEVPCNNFSEKTFPKMNFKCDFIQNACCNCMKSEVCHQFRNIYFDESRSGAFEGFNETNNWMKARSVHIVCRCCPTFCNRTTLADLIHLGSFENCACLQKKTSTFPPRHLCVVEENENQQVANRATSYHGAKQLKRNLKTNRSQRRRKKSFQSSMNRKYLSDRISVLSVKSAKGTPCLSRRRKMSFRRQAFSKYRRMVKVTGLIGRHIYFLFRTTKIMTSV